MRGGDRLSRASIVADEGFRFSQIAVGRQQELQLHFRCGHEPLKWSLYFSQSKYQRYFYREPPPGGHCHKSPITCSINAPHSAGHAKPSARRDKILHRRPSACFERPRKFLTGLLPKPRLGGPRLGGPRLGGPRLGLDAMASPALSRSLIVVI